MTFWRWLGCLCGFHKWTCAAEQGIKPDPKRARANPARYFWEYARMYCEHCNKHSELNRG